MLGIDSLSLLVRDISFKLDINKFEDNSRHNDVAVSIDDIHLAAGIVIVQSKELKVTLISGVKYPFEHGD